VQAACLGIIREHPGEYARLHLAGVLHFFLDPGRFDLYRFLSREDETGRGLLAEFSRGGYRGLLEHVRVSPPAILALFGVILLFNGIKFVSLLFLATDGRVSLATRAFLLLVVFYLALLTGPIGASRFSVPVHPLLLVAVVLGFERVLRCRVVPASGTA
jgi:hypothetical protein